MMISMTTTTFDIVAEQSAQSLTLSTVDYIDARVKGFTTNWSKWFLTVNCWLFQEKS